ncbi:MAG: cellulase family glycosylhydrolase [bacterium]|nr:cellulase family glycosylhydrolase [bacterium]
MSLRSSCSDWTDPQSSRTMAHAMSWGEAFVLIPLHAFWVLYTNTRFVAENRTSALVAAVPLAVIVVMALAAQFRRVRTALVRTEWLFHLTSAALMTLLMVHFALRDPFSQAVPLTWPLCLWSAAMTFALLSNLALHVRMRALAADAPTRWLWTVIFGLILWGGMLWLASGMVWAPYFWTASIVFHAVMAPLSRADSCREASTRGKDGPLANAAAFVEGLVPTVLVFTVVLRLVFAGDVAGAAELKYSQFVSMFANTWFLGGAAMAVLAHRYRFHLVTHAIVVIVVMATSESVRWPISLVVGYSLPALYLAIRRQGPLVYAFFVAGVSLTWLFGLFGFTLNGLITVLQMGVGAVQALVSRGAVAAAALFGVCIGFAVLGRWRRRASSAEDCVPTAASPFLARWMYPATWVLIALPIGALMAATMWPPVRMGRPERVTVGGASGLCHAGYSRTDEEYVALHDLGARLIRIPVYWGHVQPNPDTWDFSSFDEFLEVAERNDMHVVVVLGFDNNNVKQSAEGSQRSGYIAEEDIPLFVDYALHLVGRYGNRVYAWEIWNEPDIPQFWSGTMDDFYPVARQTAEAIREAYPDTRIIGTAMTSLLGLYSSEGIEGLHAYGALKPVDHPAMHTYVSDARAYYNEFKRVRNAVAKFGHPGPVWITELGAPTGGVYPWCVPAGRRAGHLIKAYTVATSLGIDKLFWHCHGDASLERAQKDPLNSEHFFGLVTDEGEWKPAAYAYRLFSEHCNNSVIRCDLVDVSAGVTARQLRTTLYRRGNGESALVLWFEPGLRQHGSARVTIDLGPLDTPALMHDVASGFQDHLLESVVDVTDKPLFITFNAPDPETPVRLSVTPSGADEGWLSLLAGLVACAAVVAWVQGRHPSSASNR